MGSLGPRGVSHGVPHLRGDSHVLRVWCTEHHNTPLWRNTLYSRSECFRALISGVRGFGTPIWRYRDIVNTVIVMVPRDDTLIGTLNSTTSVIPLIHHVTYTSLRTTHLYPIVYGMVYVVWCYVCRDEGISISGV
jgi:hypothetical protein